MRIHIELCYNPTSRKLPVSCVTKQTLKCEPKISAEITKFLPKHMFYNASEVIAKDIASTVIWELNSEVVREKRHEL